MIGFATGLDVQVSIVTRDRSAYNRNIFFFLRKLLKTVEDLLINQISLLDPTFESCGRAHPRESLFPVQHLNPLAISGESNLVEDLRELIAKHNLRRGHVIHFEKCLRLRLQAASNEHAASARENHFLAGNLTEAET